jgi:uncharacterized repeat protein (TIGR03943 family)
MDIRLYETNYTQIQTGKRLQAWAKAVLLIGLCLYFAWVIASGNLANYINARFAWLSYVAVAIFALLGAWQAWQLLRRANADDSAMPALASHGRDISWGTLAVIAIPLLLGTLVPSRPLGVEAIGGNIAITNAAAANVAEFTIDPLQRNILDWLRVFNTTTDFHELDGERADLTGFVYREPTFGEDQFMIARYSVSCCVADASALGVPVAYADAAALEPGQWVRVLGAFQVGNFRDNLLPILQVESVELIEQPQHPYLYP